MCMGGVGGGGEGEVILVRRVCEDVYGRNVCRCVCVVCVGEGCEIDILIRGVYG